MPVVSMSELMPYFDDPVPFADYRGIAGKDLFAVRAIPFDNDKGDGIIIYLNDNGSNEPEIRVCSHASAIVQAFTQPIVQDNLQDGNPVKFRFVKAVSKKGNEYYYVE